MLQVEPPQRRVEVNSPQHPDVDSMAVTKDGMAPAYLPADQLSDTKSFATGGAELGDSPLKQRVGLGDSDPSTTIRPNEVGDGDDDEFRLAAVEEPSKPPVSDHNYWQSSAPPLMPTEEWTSSNAAKSRQYLMIAFVGISGIALAGLLFVLFLRWYSTASVPMAAGTANQVQLSNEEQADNSGDELSGDNAPDNVPANTGLGGDKVSEVESGLENDIAAIDTDNTEGNAADSNISLDSDTSSANGIGTTPLVPSNNDDATAVDSDPVNELVDGSEQVQVTETALPKQLAEYAPLISFNMQFVIPDTPVIPSQAPLTAEEMGLEPNPGDANLPTVDLQERMRAELPGLIFGSRTLSQAVNLWTHLSGIPTIIDFESLAAAGIDRNSKVRVQQVEAKSLAELARQLAQSIGAELLVVENRYLSIEAPTNAMLAALPRTISLEGLLNTEDAEVSPWIEEAMTELFPELSMRWKLDGGSLHVDWEEENLTSSELKSWFAAVRMFDDWRSLKASGNQGESQALLVQSLADSRLLPELEMELPGAIPQPQPVGQALSRLCSQAGLECWIDWANVDQGGLGPDSVYAVVTHKRQLRQALSDYVENFRLVVALLDEKSLWLTSPAAYRLDSQLYVLDRGGKTVEQWQQQLRLLTPLDEAGIGRLLVLPSPDGSTIIVRCCRPSLRF